MNKSEEELVERRCRFPTAVRRDVDDTHYRSLRVFDHNAIIASSAYDHHSLRRLMQNVWAILLRCYLRNDIVSFLGLSDTSYTNHSRSNLERPWFTEGHDALFLQYQLLDDSKLHEIFAFEPIRVTTHVLRGLRLNTAVRCMTEYHGNSPKKSGQCSISMSKEKIILDDVCLLSALYSHRLETVYEHAGYLP